MGFLTSVAILFIHISIRWFCRFSSTIEVTLLVATYMKYLYSKIVSTIITFSLVLTLVPASASAQTVEELSRLIADLQAQLQLLSTAGTSTTAPSTTSSLTYGCTDLRSYPSMYQGSTDATTGGGVTLLQTFLARDTQIYPEGIKSGYFGLLTKLAVERFQTKYGVAVLGMSGYGMVGPITKNKIYSLSCLTDTVYIPDTGTVSDTTKPEVTIAQPTALSTVPSSGFTISGSVKDAAGASDIAAVAVKLVDVRAGTNLIRNATINTSTNYPTNGHPWSLNVLESWINPGATLTLIVSATDKSGNQSAVVQRTIYVSSGAVLDFAAPSVTIGSPASGATVSYADGFLAQGTAEDGVDGVGVARVEVKVTDLGTGVSRTENAVLTAENTLTKRVAWKFPVPSSWISPSKSVTLTVTAKDYNAHTSAPLARTMLVGSDAATATLDYTAPNVTITVPSLTTSTTLLSPSGFYVNGTAIDNTGGVGVAKVEVSVYDDARSATAPAWISATLQGSEWAYLVPATAITQGAKVKVSARAIDFLGNTSLIKWVDATVGTQTVAQPTIFALYDMNKDGLINALDIQYVTDVGVALKTCPTGMDCDLNNDGVVNATDASLISAAIRGIYDFNGDGKLDGADVQIVADIGVGTRSCPTSKTCDFNRDGVVSATDATMVQSAITSLNVAISSNAQVSSLKLKSTNGTLVVNPTLVIGSDTSYVSPVVTFTNTGQVNATALMFDINIVQDSSNSKHGTPLMNLSCGAALGTLNAGATCLYDGTKIYAQTYQGGSGTLVPGNARIVVNLYRENNLQSPVSSASTGIILVSASVQDTTAPTISILEPTQEQTVMYASGFAMQGNVYDIGGSGLSKVLVSVHNATQNKDAEYQATLQANNFWTVQVSSTMLAYGDTIDISVQAFDNAGNASISQSLKVFVENAPVVISPACSDSADNDSDGKIDMEDWGCRFGSDPSEYNRTPVPTNFKRGDVIVTTGNPNTRAAPAGSLLGTKSIGDVGTIIGGPKDAVLAGVEYWWWKVDFVSGSDGWVTDEWIKLKTTNTPTADTTKPTVSITEPRLVYPYPGVYSNSFAVQGTAADTGGSGLAKVLVSIYDYGRAAVTINEVSVTIVNGVWFYQVPITATTPGNNAHIFVQSVDTAGNKSNTYEAQVRVLVDTTGKSPVWMYDISGDSLANKLDVDHLNKVLLGTATCPTGKSCDFNNDSVVTLADVTKLTALLRTLYDLNSDGAIGSADVQIVSDVAVGLRSCPTGKTCDFDQSGTVNSTDANIANTAISALTVAEADDITALAALLVGAQALLAQLLLLMGQ